MGASFDMLLWSLLSRSSCLTFGRECSTVIVWVMFTLAVRTVLQLLRIEKFIPRGFIFAFPLFMQVIILLSFASIVLTPLVARFKSVTVSSSCCPIITCASGTIAAG